MSTDIKKNFIKESAISATQYSQVSILTFKGRQNQKSIIARVKHRQRIRTNIRKANLNKTSNKKKKSQVGTRLFQFLYQWVLNLELFL